MKRLFIGLLVVAVLAVAGCSKSGGFTPPIATPNQNLPLYESPATGGGGDVTGDTQASPADTGTGKALISADPDIIHKYGFGSGYDSKITVEDGAFAPNSIVTVWGETTGKDDVESPPWIYEKDIDASKEDIQLMTNEDGGIEFWVRAGESTGFFTINVGGTPASGTSGKATGGFGMNDAFIGYGGSGSVSGTWGMISKHAGFEKVLSVTITITE